MNGTPRQTVITFPNGEYDEITQGIHSGTASLERSLCDDSEQVTVEGCIASEFKATIEGIDNLSGLKIKVLQRIYGYEMPLFTGWICDCPLQPDRKSRSLTAYDDLYRCADINVADWYNSITYPVDIGVFLKSLLDYVGIPYTEALEIRQFFNVRKTLDTNSLPFSAVIKAICQIIGGFGIIKPNGEFSIVYMSNRGSIYELEAMSGFELEQYSVKAVDKVVVRSEETDVGGQYGEGSNAYIIQGNFLCFGMTADEIGAVATSLYMNVAGFSWRPCCFGPAISNPLIGCDGLRYHVTTSQGDSFETYIFNSYISGVQLFDQELESYGSEYRKETVVNAHTENLVTAYKVMKVKSTVDGFERSIEETNSNVDELTKKHSSLEQDVGKFKITVSETYETKTNVNAVNNELTKKYSELEQDVGKFKTTVSETYTTKTDFNNLAVGGTNLLPDTNVNTLDPVSGSMTRYWSDVAHADKISCEFIELTDPPIKGLKYGVRHSCTEITTGGRNLTWRASEKIEMEDGEDYTLSVYARVVSGDSATLRFRFYGNGYQTTNIVITNTEWKRISVTFTVDKTKFTDAGYCNIGCGGLVGATISTVELCGFKLEKGNKATDWTPAPEDTNVSITTLSTKYSELEQDVGKFKTTVSETYETKTNVNAVNNELTKKYSELEQDVGKFKTTVSETYETKTNVNAVNNALTQKYSALEQDVGKFKITVSETYETKTNVNAVNNALTKKYSELEQNVNGFKTTVSETYTTLDDFNNLNVGGRNLLLNSKTFSKTTTQNQTNQALNIGIFSDYFMSERAVGKQITVSFDWTTTATSGKFQIMFNNTPWSAIFPNSTITISSSNKSGRVEYTATLTDAAVNSSALYTGLRIRIDNIEGTTTVSNVKCEFGNKATDWTAAPEDMETVITSVQTVATQTANKFNWLVKSGTSATDFTLTDRMAELTADIISLNGNVKVDGTMIIDGAITANKMAIGDFTNLVDVNPDTYNPRNYTIVTDDNGVKWFKFGSDTTLGYYSVYMNYLPPNTTFNKGDKYLFRALVKASMVTSVGFRLRVFYSDGASPTYTNMASTFVDDLPTTQEYRQISFTVNTLPTPGRPIKNIGVFLETRNTKLGTIYVRELTVHRMMNNVLIADGAITADKVDVTDLFAQDIVATGSITSPILKSSDYAYSSGNYSSKGMIVDLKNKLLRTPNAAIKPDGSIVAQNGVFSGNVTATEGKIGPITIQKGQGLYYNPTTSSGFGLWATSEHDNIAFHAGANNNNIGGAPFRVYHDGSVVAGDLTAGNVNLTGGKIGDLTIQNGTLTGTGSGTKMALYPNGKSYNVTSSTTDVFFLVVYNAGGARPVGGITNSGWKSII